MKINQKRTWYRFFQFVFLKLRSSNYIIIYYLKTDDDFFINLDDEDTSPKTWFDIFDPNMGKGRRNNIPMPAIDFGPHFESFLNNGGAEFIFGAAESFFGGGAGGRGHHHGGNSHGGHGGHQGNSHGGHSHGGFFGGNHQVFFNQAVEFSAHVSSNGGFEEQFNKGLSFMNSFMQPSDNNNQDEEE